MLAASAEERRPDNTPILAIHSCKGPWRLGTRAWGRELVDRSDLVKQPRRRSATTATECREQLSTVALTGDRAQGGSDRLQLCQPRLQTKNARPLGADDTGNFFGLPFYALLRAFLHPSIVTYSEPRFFEFVRFPARQTQVQSTGSRRTCRSSPAKQVRPAPGQPAHSHCVGRGE